MHVPLRHLWNGQTPVADVGGDAELSRDAQRLWLSWKVRVVPPPSIPRTPPGFTDGLWEHDVVELFVASEEEGEPHYLELEIGPGGHWLALELLGVRQRHGELTSAPVASKQIQKGRLWQGRVGLEWSYVEDLLGPPPWRGQVTAVLSAGGGERAFLSWPSLPGERPDFHQPRVFTPLTFRELSS